MAYQFMPMYNVNQAVGEGQPNARDDVLLVQHLLTQYALVSPTFTRNAAVVPNGVYTPALGQWILAFQQLSVRSGGGMAQDGVVSPLMAREGHFVPMLGAKTATLTLLNYNLLRLAAAAHRRIAEQMRLNIVTNAG
jgi:hypothetical protein